GLMRQYTVHDVGFIMNSRTGELARTLDGAGYAFDYVSDAQIARTSAANGALVTPGNRYDVLVVPHAERMPLATLRNLLALAEGGATIVFDALPDDVPGLGRLDERRAELRALLAKLALGNGPAAGVREARLGTGRVLVGDVLAAMAATGTPREA